MTGFSLVTLSQLNEYERVTPQGTLAERINQRIEACGGQLINIALKLDESTFDLTDLFPEQPPIKYLHIIVDC